MPEEEPSQKVCLFCWKHRWKVHEMLTLNITLQKSKSEYHVRWAAWWSNIVVANDIFGKQFGESKSIHPIKRPTIITARTQQQKTGWSSDGSNGIKSDCSRIDNWFSWCCVFWQWVSSKLCWQLCCTVYAC